MTKLNSSFMIGNVEIPHRTVLAPMAGVTNSAFRTIAKEFGAGLVVMEMISEKGLLYNNEKTLHMLHIDENEHPMSIQLFGGDAEGLKRAADFIQTNTKADIVDINMGCPVNKVVKNEAGAKWLKDPDKIYHIVKEVTSVLDIPLTVKMRNFLNDHGPLNGLLQTLHLTNGPIPFLTDPLWAKFSIIFVNMWIGIPFTMLVATGIIMNLPTEQIEAAEIDGASKFQIFKSITFPQILLIMAPSLIQQFIGNINNFNVIYFLTGGGPTNSEYYQAGSTDLLVTWLYKLTVSAKDYNLASVIGILIFAISATFSLLAYTRSSSFKEGAAK